MDKTVEKTSEMTKVKKDEDPEYAWEKEDGSEIEEKPVKKGKKVK